MDAVERSSSEVHEGWHYMLIIQQYRSENVLPLFFNNCDLILEKGGLVAQNIIVLHNK